VEGYDRTFRDCLIVPRVIVGILRLYKIKVTNWSQFV
jgi:hypothetical protein